MYLIVGLGNPGKKYSRTRHNIGFLVLDRISEKLKIKVNKIKFKGLENETTINNEKIILLEPQTYMNNSGESVKEAYDFFKIKPSNLIVIVDDIDIPLFSIKIKKKGSAGTHNGLKSIISHINTDQFIRVKIGIGKPYKNQNLADFVLEDFNKKDYELMENVIDNAANAIIDIICNGVDDAMNKYNNKQLEA